MLVSLNVQLRNCSPSLCTCLMYACIMDVLHRGISPSDALTNVSEMFLVSPRTVRRWVELWETTGEKALLDGKQSVNPFFLYLNSNAGSKEDWHKVASIKMVM